MFAIGDYAAVPRGETPEAATTRRNGGSFTLAEAGDERAMSAPSRKCMNSAGLAVRRFHRSLFFASFVSNGLLRIDSRVFKDLGVIRRYWPRLKEGREPELLAISNRPRTSMFAPAPTTKGRLKTNRERLRRLVRDEHVGRLR